MTEEIILMGALVLRGANSPKDGSELTTHHGIDLAQERERSAETIQDLRTKNRLLEERQRRISAT